MKRRDFIRVAGGGALGLLLPGCSENLLSLFDHGSESLWGFNVHTYSGSKQTLQLAALRDLGVSKIRITLGLSSDLAGGYINSYAASYLGLLNDYNLSGVTAASWPSLVRQVMNRGYSLSAIEILNEPDLFLQLSAATYVQSYLKPAWEIIKSIAPSLPVVAAAPRGTQDGVIYFFQMTDAGADSFCDYRGVHLYSDTPEQYRYGSDKPFMITETGTSTPSQHKSWWRDSMTHISGVLDTSELYWYALMNSPVDGYSLIADTADAQGNPVPRSDLYQYLKDTY
jgi:hypothetical protein